MAVSLFLAVALVFSNVAILPAIFYAYWKQLYPETAVLTAVLAASTAFHVCQVGWFCFGVGVEALQVTDHFMVYTALVWFSLYFAGAAERARTSITIGTMAVMLPVIVAFIGSWVSGAIIIAIVIVLTVATLVYVFSVHGAGPPVAWGAFVVALFLLGLGVVLHVFGGDYGDENWKYPLAHSIWHILSMLSLYYVVGIPYHDANALKTMPVPTDARLGTEKGKRVGAGAGANVPRSIQRGDAALALFGTAAMDLLARAERAGKAVKKPRKKHGESSGATAPAYNGGKRNGRMLSLGGLKPNQYPAVI